jgi:purine-binding chemotaxis protein CheW
MEIGSQSPRQFSESNSNQLVVVALDEHRYALRLSAVEQIVHVVEITPLPQAPGIIFGVVNIQGRIIPVFHIRERFHLPEREIDLSDHLIIARTANRTVALMVDMVMGVVTRTSEEMTSVERISPSLDYIEGVVKLDDGLVFIHDLDTFLSVEEEKTLERAMASV